MDETRGRLLEAGISAELSAAFEAVREATVGGGRRKYPDPAYRALKRMIVCRAYGPALYELCHLVRIADACGGYERFFFADHQALPASFRSAVEAGAREPAWQRGGAEPTDAGVALRLADGVFNVAYGRMPVLAGMMEFLIGTLGFAALDAVLTRMLAPPLAQRAVGEAANALSNQLYAYLATHLPTAHEGAKFDAMLGFLGAEDGAIEISDEAILGFWCTHAASPDDPDFKLYRTVVKSFLALARALAFARDHAAAASPMPIGADDGEISPELLSHALEAIDEEDAPLARLAAEPAARIKFLAKRERDLAAPLLDAGAHARALPLSILRAETFGFTQSQITQALRRKEAATVRDLASCARTRSHAAHAEALTALAAEIDRVLKASLYALLRDDPARAGSPELAEAETAFRGIARQGFRDKDMADAETIAGIREGSTALMTIKRRLDDFLTAISPADRLHTIFEQDRPIFHAQFGQLYGGPE